jgi:SNF2 family DNA or RNA helicase
VTYMFRLHEGIDLAGSGRITPEDAERQMTTAKEILVRLRRRPGLILADEVGMGKTYVSLAVAASVSLNDKTRRPVVVMVPPSLKEKWPKDFQLFRERCLSGACQRF